MRENDDIRMKFSLNQREIRLFTEEKEKKFDLDDIFESEENHHNERSSINKRISLVYYFIHEKLENFIICDSNTLAYVHNLVLTVVRHCHRTV